jgi:hypothetical protein
MNIGPRRIGIEISANVALSIGAIGPGHQPGRIPIGWRQHPGGPFDAMIRPVIGINI